MEDEHLACAYSNGVHIYRGFLRTFEACIHQHVKFANQILSWQARCAAFIPVLTIIERIGRAATLPLGSPLCHYSFDPRECP